MWLLILVACSGSPPPAPPPSPPTLAGSKACVGCHAEIASRWSASHHALAERVRDAQAPSSVLLDGQPHGFERVIGVAPLWQPLIVGAGGRLQASSQAWLPDRAAWASIFSDERSPGDFGHWSGAGMVWNRQCAACHNTGVSVGYSGATDRYATTVHEVGVGCEACHGPSGAHAASPSTRTPGPDDAAAWGETCALCHTRGEPLTDGFDPTTPLLHQLSPALPTRGDDFAADGQVISENFEATALRLSAKHAAGITCTACHEPHGAGLRAPTEVLCAGCHPDAEVHAAQHPGAATCGDCHMPPTTYMGAHVRHDHRFAVPDPALALETGDRVACDRCHTVTPSLVTRSPWLRPTAPAAAALAGLRRDAGDAPALVARAFASSLSPAWRAVLLSTAPPSAAHTTSLRDPDPWVRLGAASGLSAAPQSDGLPALLDDPVPAVALAAARALVPLRSPDDPSMQHLRRHLEGRMDTPAAAAELGAWWSAHGRPDRAVAPLRRATALDPASSATWRGLAVTLAGTGDPTGALAALDRGLTHNPDATELHFARGLVLAELGRTADAVQALTICRRLDPTDGRAAYNLGLLLDVAGDRKAADAALRDALRLRPDDPAPAWALATQRQRAGDLKGAKEAATEVLRRDPAHAEAARLVGR